MADSRGREGAFRYARRRWCGVLPLSSLLGAVIGCGDGVQKKPSIPKAAEAESLYRQGTNLLEADPTRAVELLTRSLDIRPDVPAALYNRAVACARVGRDVEALADIERLEEVAPEIGRRLRGEMKVSAAPYTDIAASLAREGKYEEAIRKCDSALTYDPEFGDAWVVKGIALRHLGRADEALECYGKAVEVEPENHLGYLNRAELCAGLKQWPQAVADFTKAIELRPDAAAAYSGRAQAYSELGRPEEAARDRSTAMSLETADSRVDPE